MTFHTPHRLSGIAIPAHPEAMLDEICEHFVEHAEVDRVEETAFLRSKTGTARIEIRNRQLMIELACPSEEALQASRTVIAEHLFYFAGEDPFELSWSQPAAPATVPNLHHVTVLSAEDVTPHMRRVRFACDDVSPFLAGDMHVRLLVPPKGRVPVWPSYRADGRIGWPEGEDALLVRAYTIRGVDAAAGQVWIDVLQHQRPGLATPGSDFARDAKPGERVALMGPGGGGLPETKRLLMIGDESALPAIARIAEEMSADSEIEAVIEVQTAAEEQSLSSAAALTVRWLHRDSYAADAQGRLREAAGNAIAAMKEDSYVWIACEKEDVRALRRLLKARHHDRKKIYAAWYWERTTD